MDRLTQKRIDFENPAPDTPRGRQLMILRRAQIPKVRGVRTLTLKTVLRQIDDYARQRGKCWATQQTLADNCNCSIPTVKRAIAALKKMSLIAIDRRSVSERRTGCTNRYVIVWSELERFVNKSDQELTQNPPECPRSDDQGITAHDQGITAHDQGITAHDQGITLIPITAKKRNEPPPPLSPSIEIDEIETKWKEAEAELMKELTDWRTPYVAAREQVDPDYVFAVLDHYRSVEGRYGAGALYHRLLRTHPELAPCDGWPEPRSPPKELAVDRGDLSLAYRIVKAGRQAEASDEVITEVLRRHGVDWDDA